MKAKSRDFVVERRDIRDGYSISRLIHGGWQFSSGHPLTQAGQDDPIDVLEASAELGVTTFDCADIYTGVEEIFGRFIKRWASSSNETQIQIHTKFVPDWSDLPLVDRSYVRRIVERSLSRLGLERLDLVQYYWWRNEVPGFEDTAGWLDELREEGKIGNVGVTNLDVSRIKRLNAVGFVPIINQVQYSLLDRRPERSLALHCEGSQTWMLGFGALAGGFLTDRWLGESEPIEFQNRSLIKYRLIIDEFGGWEAYQALLQTMAGIAQNHGVEMSSVALRWVLDQSQVAGVICGATRLGQMERNVSAFSFSMSKSEREALRAHLDLAAGPLGEVFGLERNKAGPHGRIMRYDLNRD